MRNKSSNTIKNRALVTEEGGFAFVIESEVKAAIGVVLVIVAWTDGCTPN